MPDSRPSLARERVVDTRDRILEATRRLVAEGGFRAAQMAAVARAAGVATGTPYRHFSSKAELFVEVLARTSRREVDVVAAIAGGDGPPDARLRDGIHAFAHRAVRGHRLAYALIAEPVDPEVEKARLAYRRRLGGVFEDLLTEGIASGAFRPQRVPAAAACLVGALIEGLVGPLAPEAPETDPDALAEAIVEFCLAAVSPSQAARGPDVA